MSLDCIAFLGYHMSIRELSYGLNLSVYSSDVPYPKLVLAIGHGNVTLICVSVLSVPADILDQLELPHRQSIDQRKEMQSFSICMLLLFRALHPHLAVRDI